ncbi:MAG: CCA tRNA nucleotidyltransferase, partial [bacterium]|nr:CCA tRNA nucleotidyltransferase [bacterium]
MNKLEKAGFKIAKLLQANYALTRPVGHPLPQGERDNLKRNYYKAFYVGGFGRNKVLKLESDNMDIATDALPDQVEQILNKAKIKTKAVGKKFGTILAIVDSFPIEITTFRQESRYSDNRHPDQDQFIKDYLNDAKRRDYTINAFYYDPIKKKLYDPANGQKDIKLKLLRFVGDPKKRIDEDGLRMLRGVRLATQLGFKLEKNSFAAIKTRAKYIQGVSGERIKAELDKILLSENRSAGLELLDKIG